MRHYFKLVTASCLGTILAFLVFFFVLMLIGLSGETKTPTQKSAILHLKFDQDIPELSNNVSQGQFSFEKPDQLGLNDLKKLLRLAATDDHILGIILQPEQTFLNPTLSLQITQLLQEFKKSGKFIHAYGNVYSQSGYIIASVADTILLNPNGMIDLHGFGMTVPYLKDFSDKSKIKFDVYYAGKYKSAIEPYYLSSISDANRLQTYSYLEEYQNALIEQISVQRGIEKSKVHDIVVNALSDDEAYVSETLGLVDGVSYWDDYEESLTEQLGVKKLNLISIDDYWISQTPFNEDSGTDRIAVVYAEGEIAHSGKEKGSVSIDRYNDLLDRIKNNEKIKAVVLRVNSPGGSAFTSDIFWKKIEDIKKSGKYVVASYGTYAASGGYYISCGADRIVAEPTTLTGSIGVYSMIPDMSEFFEDKLGINWDTIGTGNHTFLYSVMVKRSESDHVKLMSSTDKIYQKFLSKVAEGRHMSIEEVNEIAQGRVWSGRQGVEVGLVDTIGTLDDAIAIAALAVGTDDYKVLQYPVITKTFYEEILSGIMSETEAQLGPLNQSFSSPMMNAIKQQIRQVEEACSTPQARLPFSIIQ